MRFIKQQKTTVAMWLLAMTCLGLSGCESTVSLERHWIGKTKESLLASWGQPSRIEEGPEGEAIYLYTKTYYPEYQDSIGTGKDLGAYTPSGEATNYPIRIRAESSTAKFWISPQGMIYRAEGRIIE